LFTIAPANILEGQQFSSLSIRLITANSLPCRKMTDLEFTFPKTDNRGWDKATKEVISYL